MEVWQVVLMVPGAGVWIYLLWRLLAGRGSRIYASTAGVVGGQQTPYRDPLRRAYQDAEVLARASLHGYPVSRRRAALMGWSERRWRHAFRLARLADVLDERGRFLPDSGEDARDRLRVYYHEELAKRSTTSYVSAWGKGYGK